MKKFLLPLLCLCALTLSACSGSTHSFELEFKTEDKREMAELSLAATRVIERRTVHLGAELQDLDIERNGNTTILTVQISNKDAAKQLAADLTAPFTFELMHQVAEEDLQDGDLMVEGHGNFRATGIDAADIEWLSAQEDDVFVGKGAVIVRFGDAGVEKVQQLFAEHQGKFVGLFVRKQLAAKIKVEDETIDDVIVISQLPSIELARVFVDDVNVGRYITFKKL